MIIAAPLQYPATAGRRNTAEFGPLVLNRAVRRRFAPTPRAGCKSRGWIGAGCRQNEKTNGNQDARHDGNASATKVLLITC
ncbi:MAG: hypothetical protein VW600_12365, partial [Ferrovibrio sp.]